MVRAPPKALKIGRALKTAALLPTRISGVGKVGRNAFSPLPGETPIVVLRIRVIGCENLLAKDKNGFSDPCATIAPRVRPTLTSLFPIDMSSSPS